jgi:hypothetical protein
MGVEAGSNRSGVEERIGSFYGWVSVNTAVVSQRILIGRAIHALLAVVVGWIAVTASACHAPTASVRAERAVSQEMPESIAAGLRPLALAQDAAAMRALARERGYVVRGDAVLVVARTQGMERHDRERFEGDGRRVVSYSVEHQRVGVAVATPEALRSLGRVEVVRRVEPTYGGTSRGSFALPGAIADTS